MPRYLSTLNLSADAYKGLVANPHNRMDAAAPLFQSIGGTLEHYWFGVGETFIYVEFSAPDNPVDVQALYYGRSFFRNSINYDNSPDSHSGRRNGISPKSGSVNLQTSH